MKTLSFLLASAGMLCGVRTPVHAADISVPVTNALAAVSGTNVSGWLTRPLSLADALNIADGCNATILKARKDLESAAGVILQTRAILIPKLQVTGTYTANDPDSVEQMPLVDNTSLFPNMLMADQSWNTGVRLMQSVYEGGRMNSSVRTSRLIRRQAVHQYQSVLSTAFLNVRTAYYDILLAEQQIVVQEASVTLLGRQLEDTQRRFDAGTVPRFDVLRAEVALANAKPKLIRARNQYRISKNNLVNLLGGNLSKDIGEDIPMILTTRLEALPATVVLAQAIEQALRQRPEIAALQEGVDLQKENVVGAKAGYKPSIQVFGGYGAHSRQFSTDISRELHGWSAGAQMSWNLFDGFATQGRIQDATAQQGKAEYNLDDGLRNIELEVRTRYSEFIEAREVLESQKKVLEQAEESLRLAKARYDAGTGTQLDVLDAQTSLTDARSINAQALHGYAVALSRMEHAVGADVAAIKQDVFKP